MALTESVLIRPFQRGDEQGVWDILQEGTYSNMNATFMIFGKKAITQIVSVGLLVLGYACGLSPFFLLICGVVGIAVVYLFVLLGALVYLYGSTLSDIRDIHTSYFKCPDHHFWVAEYNGQIAGTIAIVKKSSHLEGSPDARLGRDCLEGSAKVAWLRRMAVGKKFRRLGIAKKLVNACVLFCKDRCYDSIFLITTEVHHAARSLYRNAGFKLLSMKPYRYVKGLVTVLTYEYEMSLS